MREAFSPRARDPAWLAQVQTWIERQAAEHGIATSGPLEVAHVRAWSILATVPSERGRLWFKANCAPMRFEAALLPVLSELAPEVVVPTLATDLERGWLLQAEHAGAVGDQERVTTAHWVTAIRNVARLQRATSGARHRLLAAGLLDAAPNTVPERFDRLVHLMEDSSLDDSARLSAAEAADLRDARGLVADAVETLAGLPVSLQHGDAHPWNLEAGTGRLFDFGDAQWACCLESLCIPQNWISGQDDIDFAPVAAAYAEVWEGAFDVDEELMRAAHLTHEVNRAVTWWNAMHQMTAEEWRAWGDSPRKHLLNLLTPAPGGPR